jgi:DNA invertase Pin-like site-specific DNA recombinase
MKKTKKHNTKVTAVYCRVSTFDQEKGLRSQELALKNYCINHELNHRVWYRDRLSGASTNRPAFNKLQEAIFAGKVDTVICWKLDRVSRSVQDGINILCDWLKQGIRFVSITEQFDFNGLIGQTIASLLFGLAALGRESLRENTKRGLLAAKARGSKLGKRPLLFCKDIVPMLQNGMSIAEVADNLAKSRMAVYNTFKREGIDLNKLLRECKR